jgi:hypothetical protein
VVLARGPECLDRLRDVRDDQFRGLKWTVPVATGKHLWTDTRHSFRGLFRSDPLLIRGFIDPVRKIGGAILIRLAKAPGSGVTAEQQQEFSRRIYQLSDALGRPTLELRYWLESWSDDEKK